MAKKSNWYYLLGMFRLLKLNMLKLVWFCVALVYQEITALIVGSAEIERSVPFPTLLYLHKVIVMWHHGHV